MDFFKEETNHLKFSLEYFKVQSSSSEQLPCTVYLHYIDREGN